MGRRCSSSEAIASGGEIRPSGSAAELERKKAAQAITGRKRGRLCEIVAMMHVELHSSSEHD